jgi:hypothetical protein
MQKRLFVSLVVTTSLLTLISGSTLAPASRAQAYPYSFCKKDTETPDQNLVDSIAFVLDFNYEGDVKSVSPVCYGSGAWSNNRGIWVYTVEFQNGTSLDVAISESDNGRLISVQDPSKASANAGGWTAWIPLKSPK